MALYKFASGLRNALNVATSTRNLGTRNHATLKECKERLRDMHLPEKPKKPLTPYFRFLKDFRQDLVKSNPEVKVTDVVKQAAADWAKTHATIKDKYMSEYKQDLQEYTLKMSAYTAKLTPEQRASIKEVQQLKVANKKKKELKKKSRDLDKPKRPLGPYMQFLLEKSKTTNEKMVVLMQQLKGQYQTLPDAEKLKYTQRYEDDKKRYDVQMLEWERKMLAEGHEDVVRQSALQRSKPTRLAKAAKLKKP